MAESNLNDLTWMVGHWQGRPGSGLQEELWLPPMGGLMLGLHRDVPAPDRAFFELLRIEVRPGGIVYVAQPGGGPPTEFKLARCGPDEVLFENLKHDFPQRILYRRQGDILRARIEGLVGTESRSQEWSWRLIRDMTGPGAPTGGKHVP